MEVFIAIAYLLSVYFLSQRFSEIYIPAKVYRWILKLSTVIGLFSKVYIAMLIVWYIWYIRLLEVFFDIQYPFNLSMLFPLLIIWGIFFPFLFFLTFIRAIWKSEEISNKQWFDEKIYVDAWSAIFFFDLSWGRYRFYCIVFIPECNWKNRSPRRSFRLKIVDEKQLLGFREYHFRNIWRSWRRWRFRFDFSIGARFFRKIGYLRGFVVGCFILRLV